MSAVTGTDSDTEKRRWHTPTGDPCPRSQHLDGRVDSGGDCHGCGFCLLLAGLVEVCGPQGPDDARGRKHGAAVRMC